MKVLEIINEVRQAKPSKRQIQSSRGVDVYRDAERANTDYVAYRLGQAMACTDGKTVPDMDPKSWIGKTKSIHPYTKEEQDMFKQAAKVVGANYKDLNHGDMRSLELDSTNKTSPVAKRKTNKYGV
jgi:hypothetical protein